MPLSTTRRLVPSRDVFHYMAVVPDPLPDGSLGLTALSVDEPTDRPRFAGYQPTIDVVDDTSAAGLSRVTIRTTNPSDAVLDAASFSVDRDLARTLRPGDILHLAGTRHRRPGLSILRDGALVCAVGDVCRVPLGEGVSAVSPVALVRVAEELFQERDPEYFLTEWPVEIAIGGVTRLLDRGRRLLGGYEVFIVRRYEHARGCCVSISRVGLCPDAAGAATAMLLDQQSLDIVGYRGHESGD
jgi:hypothetical protein